MKEHILAKLNNCRENLTAKKVDSIGRGLMTAFMCALLGVSTIRLAGAYNISLFENLANAFNAVKADLVAFSSIAAGTCLAVCIILIMFSKNEKAVAASWNWLKRIIICYVALLGLGTIISTIADFADTSGMESGE